jgi:hypothetical protein
LEFRDKQSYTSGMASLANDRILNRVLDSVSECLTPDVASRIVALRADPRLQRKLDELAEKNSTGTLTRREESEYETYIEALDVIAILQATARKALRAAGRTR